MRNSFCRLLAGALAGAVFVLPPTAGAAPAAGAQLPDWDAAKPKKDAKPAELPDWDAAKPKKDPKPKKPKQPKQPKETPVEAPAETPTETPSEAPSETPAPVEAPPAETPSEAPPTEAPVVATAPVVEGPAEAPAVDTGTSKEAQRVAKREIIAGAALIGLGVGGFAVMGAGFALRDKEDPEADKGPVTMVSAGAILGTIGTVMGLALLGEGIKDRRAARPRAQARVLPTFGGLAITGRF